MTVTPKLLNFHLRRTDRRYRYEVFHEAVSHFQYQILENLHLRLVLSVLLPQLLVSFSQRVAFFYTIIPLAVLRR